MSKAEKTATETVPDDDFQTEMEKLTPLKNHKADKKADRARQATDRQQAPVEGNSDLTDLPTDRPVSETYLRKAEDLIHVAELLASGMSIRQVIAETGISKTFVESVSKNIDRNPTPRQNSSNPRTAYLNKPYEALLEKEARKESQTFLSDKISSMVEDALLLSLQVQVYRDVLGLGGKKNNGDNDMFEKMMLAKVVGGGQSLSGKELIEFASALKTVLTPQQQNDSFLEKYTALEAIKTQGIEKYRELTTAAYSQAKAESDKNFTKEIVGKIVDTAAPFVKNLTLKPVNIPGATEATASIPPPLQGPTQSQLEALSLPVTEPIQGEGVPIADTIGYSNISKPDLSKKTEVI